MNATDRDRVSLNGLTPEEALRALLAVDPNSEAADADDDAAEADQDTDE